MRAFQRVSAGRAELREVERPMPTEIEVVVDLLYCGVNPFDMQVLRGEIGRVTGDPLTLGSEATGLLDGRLVQVSGGGLGAALHGTFAEQVVVPRASVKPLPGDADPRAAATIGVAGKTAWRAVHQLANVGKDDVVLILGAGGGVGLFAAQLAKAAGAVVLAQTANAERAHRLAELDLEPIFGPDPDAVAQRVANRGVSVVLDPLGGSYLAQVIPVLTPGATAVVYGALAGTTAPIPIDLLYKKGIAILGTAGGVTSADDAEAALEGALAAVLGGRVVVPPTSLD